MLVDEHAGRDAACVEAVQEVLHVLVGYWIHAKSLLVLHYPLSHCGYHIIVPVPHVNQSLCEPDSTRNLLEHCCHYD